MTSVWLAAHIYYDASGWEPVLRDLVSPLVDEVMGRELAEQFFFIRYFERGKHLRLRFRGNHEVLTRDVKPMITARAEAYMTRNPSERKLPEGVDAASLNYYPNNSVQFIEYEPEVERYGGTEALMVGERQFEASSRAALSAITESASWDYTRALGVALQMHFAMAHAFQLDPTDVHGMFAIVNQGWLPRAYNHGHTKLTPEQHKQRSTQTLAVFNEMFASQKEMLIPFVQQLWAGLEENAEFEDLWFGRWIDAMRETHGRLSEIHNQGDLLLDDRRKFWWLGADYPKHRELWLILESYVHMTNNRLGILNQDEAYLGYLIQQTAKHLDKGSP